MSLSPEELAKIAYLARLQVDPGEGPALAAQLSRILHFVAQMNAADTSAVEPMAHPLDLRLRLREDLVTEGDQRDLFLSLAPATEAGVYLVPKVID